MDGESKFNSMYIIMSKIGKRGGQAENTHTVPTWSLFSFVKLYMYLQRKNDSKRLSTRYVGLQSSVKHKKNPDCSQGAFKLGVLLTSADELQFPLLQNSKLL